MTQVFVLYTTLANHAAVDRYDPQKHIQFAQKIRGLLSQVISEGPVRAIAGDGRCVVNEVGAEPGSKTGFVSGFEEVVAGSDPSQKRLFLERAKMCWGMPQA
jgi:hypothetical protein